MSWGTDLYSVDDMQYMPWTTQNVYAVDDIDVVHGI